MSAYLRRQLRPVHGLLIGGAWFFIVVSLLHLFWVIGEKFEHPGGVTKLYHTVVGGVSYDALGLTYSGTAGLVQAALQAAIVVVAAAATILPLQGPRGRRWRRIGHVSLIGWAALWAANLFWLATVDGQLDSVSQTSILTVMLAGTIDRAIRGWTPPGRVEMTGGAATIATLTIEPVASPATDVAAGEKVTFTVRDVGGSGTAAEIARPRHGFSWNGMRSTIERMIHRGRTALVRLPRPGRGQVRRGIHVSRREAARGLRSVAGFTARQADRLAASQSAADGSAPSA